MHSLIFWNSLEMILRERDEIQMHILVRIEQILIHYDYTCRYLHNYQYEAFLELMKASQH